MCVYSGNRNLINKVYKPTLTVATGVDLGGDPTPGVSGLLFELENFGMVGGWG